MKKIFYRDGYKYQLAANYSIGTDIKPAVAVVSDFLALNTDGNLIICAGYAWDGPSGPVIDIDSFMRASLVHDALYRLMREGGLPQSYKLQADKLMRKICLEDGMAHSLVEIAYQGVEHFGYSSCKRQAPDIKSAP